MRKLIIPLCLAALVIAGCNNSSGGNDNHSTDAGCSGTEINPDRLFIQQLGSDQVIIKWRGNKNGGLEADAICYGTDMNSLDLASETKATITATGHNEVHLTMLEPDTTYYYSVGGAAQADAKRSFHTSPANGDLPSDGNTRLFIVGDSGVGGYGKTESKEVFDAYTQYVDANGGEKTDLFLMLGDNAYNQGTDLEHQLAVFDVYTDLLSNTPVWPTIGNHEMGSVGASTSSDFNSYALLGNMPTGTADPIPDSPMPYLNIFTLPTNGEIGGLSSGTELYYSFDYANLHIVSLDSQLSARDDTNRATMLQWVKDDLMSSSADWKIVIFHHPPYSKGSHDSDLILGGIDQPIFDMREEFTPVFESHGVDLVYGGHSHIYERSYYLKGHTGLSATFDPLVHAELNDLNLPANGKADEIYTQVTKSGMDDKVVYTVAGNSGKVTTTSNGFPHPAHFFSQLIEGAVLIDAGKNSLDVKFISINGAVLDNFTVTR
jgi:hypothetical protein